MREQNLGLTLAEVVIPAAVIGLAVLVVVVGEACNGTCAAVQCTESAPCTINGASYTAGSICASPGSVCVKHSWPFADCLCATVIGQGQLPRPSCFK